MPKVKSFEGGYFFLGAISGKYVWLWLILSCERLVLSLRVFKINRFKLLSNFTRQKQTDSGSALSQSQHPLPLCFVVLWCCWWWGEKGSVQNKGAFSREESKAWSLHGADRGRFLATINSNAKRIGSTSSVPYLVPCSENIHACRHCPWFCLWEVAFIFFYLVTSQDHLLSKAHSTMD